MGIEKTGDGWILDFAGQVVRKEDFTGDAEIFLPFEGDRYGEEYYRWIAERKKNFDEIPIIKANFRNATFTFAPDFSSALFLDEADFTLTHFRKGVFFSHARFGRIEDSTGKHESKSQTDKHVLFQSALFGDLDIDSIPKEKVLSIIERSSDKITNRLRQWYESRQNDEITRSNLIRSLIQDLDRETLHKSITRDSGSVDFKWASFTNDGSVDFEWASFANSGDVDFIDTSFANSGAVYFHRASFANSGDVKFCHTSFANSGNVDFTDTSFANFNDVDFTDTSFANFNDVDFESASFANVKGELYFSRVVWCNQGHSNLTSIEWGEYRYVTFLKCLFLSEVGVNFRLSRFPEKGALFFRRCLFDTPGVVDFTGAVWSHAVFEGGVINWEGKEQLGDIVNSQHASKNTEYPLPQFTHVFSKETPVFWSQLSVESAKNLLLRLVNLHGSRFDGVTLKHVELNAPEWSRSKDGKRNILPAEKDLDSTSLKAEVKDVINQYQQLKSNLENYRDFRDAGDFHYGEQELRWKYRKALGNDSSWAEQFMRLIFWLSSGYGERPLQAFLLFVDLVIWSGVVGLVWYTFGNLSLEFLKPDDGLITVAVKMFGHVINPFRKIDVDIIDNSNSFYYLVHYTFKAFIYTQFAMLIFAIRRRFKR